MALPPGPTEPALVQQLRWLRDPLRLIEDCARRHGMPYTIRFPFIPPWVFFSDPAAIKDIFTASPDEARAGEANVLLKSVLGEHSLLLLDGERHLRERKLMMPPFHGERMRAYGDTMKAITRRTMARWPVGRAFPVHHEMHQITLEVILRTIFGLEEGARLDKMRELLTRFATLGTSPLGTLLLLMIPPAYAQQVTNFGMDPIPVGPFKLDLSPLVPWKALVRARRAVDDLLYEEIDARRAAGTAGREDVLSMLMEAEDDHGKRMTDVELRDQMLTLLLAGHETSATTLAWTVHHLLAHPEAMAAVRADLDRGSQELLEAAIKETLRLTPIIGMVGRKLASPQRIGGIDLPAGVTAIACIWQTHHRAELYPEPHRFDVRRFVGKKTDPYEYLPFGGGTRRCLGQAFAMYEMKIVLAEVLQGVALRPAPGAKVTIVRRGITFAPSEGVPVVRYS